MTETTQHTPADVRERVVDEIIVTVRTLCPGAAGSVATAAYAAADRILALLRTPRGEGEAWRAFLDALDEFEAAANLWADPEGPTAADMERLRQSRQRVIECARALATIRPEAQGQEEPVAWLVECRGVEMFGWHPVYVYLGRQNAENIARVMRDGEWDVRVVPLYRAAPWEDVVFGPITEAYNEAHAARPTDRSESDGE